MAAVGIVSRVRASAGGSCDSRTSRSVSRCLRYEENVSFDGCVQGCCVRLHPLSQEIEVTVPDEGAAFEVIAVRNAVEGTTPKVPRSISQWVRLR